MKSTPGNRTTVFNSQAAPTCIDLFAGAGGLSLGLHRTGWNVLAAIDADPHAVAVYRANIPDTRHVLCEDLTSYPPASLAARIGTDRVDLIAGGPPCQGFSQVRQRDGSNSGSRLVYDPRRSLYVRFFEHVGHFRPKAFVMENVVGIRSAVGGEYFKKVQATAREFGYRVNALIAEAWKFGIPQKRRRQLIVGIREDVPGYFTHDLFKPTVTIEEVMLGHAIGDLPVLAAGEGNDPVEYDLKKRERSLKNESAATYLTRVFEVQKARSLTAHVARPHNDRDLRDFQKLREGEHAKQATDRGEELEFPYDRGTFHDRYTRQHRRRLCSTIVAHLSKDGLMFIHPTQNRSLTPREAARVQTFPDWFQFSVARTHQFRLIGNAVPPIMGEVIGKALAQFLRSKPRSSRNTAMNETQKPKSDLEASLRLVELMNAAEAGRLQDVSNSDFKAGWAAVSFLYPGLHPDNALEHGDETSVSESEGSDSDTIFDPRLTGASFVLSGWPVALAPIATEAWRRYEASLMKEDEFYCCDALLAGIEFRSSAGG